MPYNFARVKNIVRVKDRFDIRKHVVKFAVLSSQKPGSAQPISMRATYGPFKLQDLLKQLVGQLVHLGHLVFVRQTHERSDVNRALGSVRKDRRGDFVFVKYLVDLL